MGRKYYQREQVQRFLIVCEGEATEPLYFASFRVPGDIKELRIKGIGRSADKLVEAAIDLKQKDEYDQTWVVFDIDNNQPNEIHQAIQKARKNNIYTAHSNQAFELWYLLHFQYHNTAIQRTQYTQKLSKILRSPYDKNRPDMFILLKQRQAIAIANAKRLEEQYNPPDPARDDPSTTVYRLVEELNRFTPDSRRS